MEIFSTASHDAYLKSFGYVHKRDLKLDKKNNLLSGTDFLILKKSGTNINYSIRFHLYPGISAVKTIGGNSILIQFKKNFSRGFWASRSKYQKNLRVFFKFLKLNY